MVKLGGGKGYKWTPAPGQEGAGSANENLIVVKIIGTTRQILFNFEEPLWILAMYALL